MVVVVVVVEEVLIKVVDSLHCICRHITWKWLTSINPIPTALPLLHPTHVSSMESSSVMKIATVLHSVHTNRW